MQDGCKRARRTEPPGHITAVRIRSSWSATCSGTVNNAPPSSRPPWVGSSVGGAKGARGEGGAGRRRRIGSRCDSLSHPTYRSIRRECTRVQSRLINGERWNCAEEDRSRLGGPTELSPFFFYFSFSFSPSSFLLSFRGETRRGNGTRHVSARCQFASCFARNFATTFGKFLGWTFFFFFFSNPRCDIDVSRLRRGSSWLSIRGYSIEYRERRRRKKFTSKDGTSVNIQFYTWVLSNIFHFSLQASSRIRPCFWNFSFLYSSSSSNFLRPHLEFFLSLLFSHWFSLWFTWVFVLRCRETIRVRIQIDRDTHTE